MQDLIVCIGETCHQSGAEHVLKTFMDLVAAHKLENEITIKASFCIGGCCEQNEVSARLGDSLFQVSPETAEQVFTKQVHSSPTLNPEV
ncbi:MAG: hypothetical protein GY780_11345 [bacterium]|nr:hypothetical protein [bacterium]